MLNSVEKNHLNIYAYQFVRYADSNGGLDLTSIDSELW